MGESETVSLSAEGAKTTVGSSLDDRFIKILLKFPLKDKRIEQEE